MGRFVIGRVKKLSKNRQEPVNLIPDGYRDFVIGVAEQK